MDKNRISTFSFLKDEPEIFREKRLQAFELVKTLDYPTIQRVNYKDWDFSSETFDEESVLSSVPSFDKMSDHPFFLSVDGEGVYSQLPQQLIEQGVILEDLFTAMIEHKDLVEKYYLTKALTVDEDKMSALHAAMMNGGLFLYVPKNVKIEMPIETIFQHTGNKTLNTHVLIVADEHSEFSYIEKFEPNEVSPQTKISANIQVEVITEAGAKVKFAAVDRLGENVTGFIARRGHLGKDSEISWAIGVMNDGNTVYDLDSDLKGEASHSDMKVVAISSGEQIQGIDTRVTNFSNHTVGNILQHGVILDHSTLTFNGIGHIIKGAKFADAQQESRVLMLSDSARGDANPILLIDENEVTAGHAASIGQVDEEDMYYLMSRGIEEKEAQRLVIRGFLGAVITAIPVKTLQNEFIERIEGKLANV